VSAEVFSVEQLLDQEREACGVLPDVQDIDHVDMPDAR
jgi:hypothetical protein